MLGSCSDLLQAADSLRLFWRRAGSAGGGGGVASGSDSRAGISVLTKAGSGQSTGQFLKLGGLYLQILQKLFSVS